MSEGALQIIKLVFLRLHACMLNWDQREGLDDRGRRRSTTVEKDGRFLFFSPNDRTHGMHLHCLGVGTHARARGSFWIYGWPFL